MASLVILILILSIHVSLATGRLVQCPGLEESLVALSHRYNTTDFSKIECYVYDRCQCTSSAVTPYCVMAAGMGCIPNDIFELIDSNTQMYATSDASSAHEFTMCAIGCQIVFGIIVILLTQSWEALLNNCNR